MFRLHAGFELVSFCSLIVILIAAGIPHSAQPAKRSVSVIASQRKSPSPVTPEEVRAEFLHAWNGYKRFAWGHDALRPLTKTPFDWYGESLWMTPVDALDTMLLMGMKREAERTKAAIVANLSFDKDLYVQNFEVTIRLLGGLLSAYQMTGDKRLLALANDLGSRLLPAFNSPTGIPYRFVNLRTGKTRDAETNPAEAGTLLIEFGTLAKLTHRPEYYDRAKRALVEIYKRRSPLGLYGSSINCETGNWTDTDSHIGGGIDSYYEYLWKCWVLFGDRDCKAMWETSIQSVNRYLADEVAGSLWYGHSDMLRPRRTSTTFGALEAFFPAVLAMSGDLRRAAQLQQSCVKMWMLHGIEPEQVNYRTMEVVSAGYQLRPEIIESAYYLYHYTGERQYREMAATFWRSFVKYCRTDEAYAALQDVKTKQQRDRMESFLFAETFKYFYLLFSPSKFFDFKHIVFNTEAHPISRTW